MRAAELEGIINTHELVLDSCVVGVPDVAGNELVKAFIVRKEGGSLDEQMVKDHVRERVVYYIQLTGGVVFLDAIPKTPSGKLLRRELRSM